MTAHFEIKLFAGALLALAACGGKADDAATSPSSTVQGVNSEKVGSGDDSATGCVDDKTSAVEKGANGNGHGSKQPAVNECFTVDLGGACADPSNAKSAAVAVCEAKGHVITDLSFRGKGEGDACAVTCCAAAPNEPSAESYTGAVLGDGLSCIADVDVKKQAFELCTATKSELRGVYAGGECPGGITIAKVVCCASGGAPPPEKAPPLK